MKPGAFIGIARLILQNTSALSICSGESNGVYDSDLITDWNDLPCLPATAITGVLRSLWRSYYPSVESVDENALFGFQNAIAGKASRLAVSFGLMTENNKVFETLDLEDEIRKNYPQLKRAQALARDPNFRHGVRINHRGVVDGDGKFDIAVLGKGFSFALELKISGDTKDNVDKELTKLLKLFYCPDFRLGRRTRSGYGEFEVKQARSGVLSAREAAAVPKGLLDKHEQLSDTRLSAPEVTSDAASQSKADNIRFALQCGPGGIRVGGGEIPLDDKVDADLVAYTELDADGKRFVVIPGTSVRGVLRHRTLFYLRCQKGLFIGNGAADNDAAVTAINQAFGYAANNATDSDQGQAGKFWFSDIYLGANDVKAKARTRNSIDRFTGGVRMRMLFTEENIYPKKYLDFKIFHRGVADEVTKAFNRALADLKCGRLALGGNGTNGVGLLYAESPGFVTRAEAAVKNS
jgi:CRISPR/Cas system CSM-associated protein Csm3 (group 7 of RAMP superfamily)